MAPKTQTATVLLPTLPDARPLAEAVLFAFDDQAFPFRSHVQTFLITGQQPRLVPHGNSQFLRPLQGKRQKEWKLLRFLVIPSVLRRGAETPGAGRWPS